jgi:mannitol/fructose-specific phosphotransferase system IIA component (Ntr-type)
VHRVLPWIQAYTSATGSVLGLVLSLALFSAAFTEWVGVHAIFGAFLAGVALGDSKHLRERTRATIDQFVSFIFAPIFFATIGLQVDFVASFAPLLTLLVVVVACVGKIGGCVVGARLIGMPRRDAWAVGFGMNARGAMEIILGLIARREGIIGDELFVALVVMAIVTSMASGPVVQAFLRGRKTRRFAEFLSVRTFRPALEATNAHMAIGELARAAEAATGVPALEIERAVIDREELMPTGLEGGVAVPHARLPGLKTPMVAVGLSAMGIDFDTPDGKPARLLFLILTPEDDAQVQLEIIGDIARSFSDAKLAGEAATTTNFTQFLALVRTAY